MTSTEDLNPVIVEAKIRETVTRITRGAAVCNDRYREKLRAAAEYDHAFAAAYMNHDGPAHEKRYAAELATSPQRAVRDVADAAHRYAEAQARALRDELDAWRSVGASLREAYRSAGAL